jgi:AcrR family transcriptional regulator
METRFGNMPGVMDAEAVETAMPTRAERRDQQTQRILEAAKSCFVRSGFQGASMNEICVAAGMSPGALYRYFASKEAIIGAICEADRREDAKVFETVLSNPDVIEGMVVGAMTHIRFVHETNAAPLFAEICAEAMRNCAVESTCRDNMEQVQAMFLDYLGRAQERGEIDPAVELDIVVPTLMAIIHGMALNDLPALGIPFEKLEILVRASLVAMLRPTGKIAGKA